MKKRCPKNLFVLFVTVLLGTLGITTTHAADEAEAAARQGLAVALAAPEAEQPDLIIALKPHPVLKVPLETWSRGGIFIYTAPDGARIPFTLDASKVDAAGLAPAARIDTGAPLADAAGVVLTFKEFDLTPLETTSKLRRAIRSTTDMLALADPNPALRQSAVLKLGMKQLPTALPILEVLQAQEKDPSVKKSITEATALINLTSTDPDTRIAALGELKKLSSVASKSMVEKIAADPGQPAPVKAAATSTLRAIENHLYWVDFFGTIFRGVSLGSVLLVVALGLAITFGLMGVINMAHGEIMVVGGYATYLVQCIFGAGVSLAPFGISLTIPGMNLDESSALYQSYFLFALPVAFISAALVGLLLERSVIQFLYRRPLESLLATWGVSLVLQQVFRLVFGPANAPVYSPAWLLGSFSFGGVIMNYNRVFVIGFAIFIVLGTALLLAKTPLGLLIRAVMQDRNMASCMGVRTEKINMLTFAFGSGLAGLAGAFLSQIGNIGPSTGQTYIVDSFMVVVVGGVGNLIGTVISALGIGTIDQILQTWLRNPVIGKVLVLVGIILFLQWKPSGLFATKGRGLEN
jgi:urea transport system permease protein